MQKDQRMNIPKRDMDALPSSGALTANKGA